MTGAVVKHDEEQLMAVSVAVCAAGGGIPTVSGKSSTGAICDGGTHDGKEIAMILKNAAAKVTPFDKEEVQRAIDIEMKAYKEKK